jgi:hypothetical protein
MRSYVRQFFWLTITASMLLVFTNFTSFSTKPEVIPENEAVKDEPGARRTNDANAVPGDLMAVAGEETVLGSHTAVIEGRTYVLIDGKWFPKSAEGIYLVNGKKIYFVDNSGRRKEETAAVKPPQAFVAPSVPAAATSDTGVSVPTSALDAYNPKKLNEMMQTLQQAKARMKERDEALKALSSSQQD